MKVCPKCGKESESKFCPDCGTELVESQESVIAEADDKAKPTGNEEGLDSNENNEQLKECAESNDSIESSVKEQDVQNGKSLKKGILESLDPGINKNDLEEIKTDIKNFFKKKWVKRTGIILGILIALFIVFTVIGYILAPNIDKDFDKKDKYQMHGLSYYVPKNWKPTDKLGFNTETKDNTQAYQRNDEDGSRLVYMDVTYEGESIDITTEECRDKYYLKGEVRDSIQKDSYTTKEGYVVKTATQENPDITTYMYVCAVECDGSVFSIKFLYDYIVDGTEVFDEIIDSIALDEYENPKIVKKLTATYDGDTEAGTEIDQGDENISVTAVYDIGGSEELSSGDWKLQNPGVLEADKTSEFTIEYKGATCTLKIECSTLSESGYKDKCKKYSYDSLSRNPEKYEGKYIKVSGKVIQEQGNVYRIATKGNYDNVVYVTFTNDSGARILEDDKVTVYGTYYGVYSYTTVMGSSVTIPRITAEYID